MVKDVLVASCVPVSVRLVAIFILLLPLFPFVYIGRGRMIVSYHKSFSMHMIPG
jgi:hypothetical protein